MFCNNRHRKMTRTHSLHYRPGDAWFLDPIPFYWNGIYHVFFMKRLFEDTGGGDCWGHIASRNLVRWEEYPDAIAPGPKGSVDEKACTTGSVLEKDGLFHMFYCGMGDQGQTVCHATSLNLITWTKDRRNPIVLPDPTLYEMEDWRDPEVFLSPEGDGYWMLIAAKTKRADEINYYHACTALATSSDLEIWKVESPIARSSILYMDCPTLHRMEDTWCLLMAARYTTIRLAKSPRGPWRKALRESPDSIYTSAGKAMFDGHRHILVNWLGRRENEKDLGAVKLGGIMTIPRHLYLDKDGQPAVRCPAEILDAYRTDELGSEGLTRFTPDSHQWRIKGNVAEVSVPDTGAVALLHHPPSDYLLTGRVTLSSISSGAGIFIRTSPGRISSVDQGYQILFEPDKRRVSMRALNPYEEFCTGMICETTFDFSPGRPIRFQLFLDGAVVELFLDDRYVLTSNLYARPSGGGLGFMARDGHVRFDQIFLKTRTD